MNLVISDEITVINNIKIKADDMKPEITLNENIKAPIIKGQELGSIKYSVDDLEYNAKLLAENDVEHEKYYVQILIGSIIAFCILIIIKSKGKKIAQY